jgi:HK97 family phage major capsid protein
MNREQIAERRKAIAARLLAIAALVAGESRTITEAEQTESDTLESEDVALASTDRFLARMEARANAGAQLEPVQQRQAGALPSTATRGAPVVLTKTNQEQRNGDKFKGQTGLRMVIARLAAGLSIQRGEVVRASQIAAERWAGRPEIAKLLAFRESRQYRNANEIAAGGTGSGDWGHELVQADTQYAGDFIDFLYATTVFDRLALTEVPSDVVVKGQDGAATAYFTGEHKAIPMSAQDFSSVSLARLKVAALAAVSRDLIERSSPSAEALVGTGLQKAIAQKVDGLFFSTTAASAGVAPAGILNGISGHASVGGTLEDLYTDLRTLAGTFITAKTSGGGVFVSDKNVAEAIGCLLNGFGQPAFPDIDEDGGTLRKRPYLTGDNIPSGNLIRLKPSEIYKIGDSGAQIALSGEATLEMASDPTGAGDATPVAQSKQMVNMFQSDMVAIRVIRDINWAARRSAATIVDRITAADYDGTHSTTD